MEKPNTTGSFERIFDDDFRMVSYNFNNDRMLGMDVEVNKNGKSYLMSIEALSLHMERSAAEDSDSNLEETAYVLSGDEILPSDIQAIKEAPFEQIAPFLIEQD